jgi:Clostripain family
MNQPDLLSVPEGCELQRGAVTLAVYAPFGGDSNLSDYFKRQPLQPLTSHPLYQNLLAVAQQGVHVCALIDLLDDDTYLVQIDANQPDSPMVVSRWKQQMESANNLSGFLLHAHAWQPQAQMVLALEGHGAGYVPHLDTSKLTLRNVTDNGKLTWKLSHKKVVPKDSTSGQPVLPMGNPTLAPGNAEVKAMGNPTLPMGNPTLPAHMPLSTWGLGQALRVAMRAGMPKLQVVHLNNCFNMSVELLHTLAPCAQYATGYPNYNFFTSGAGYPAVFAELARVGSASAESVATRFADFNQQAAMQRPNHPTIGCVVRLERMAEIAGAVDALSDALLTALRSALPADQEAVRQRIQGAIHDAQQYDSRGPMELQTPDELTDLASLAEQLARRDFSPHPVRPAAIALLHALKGIKRYGDNDRPWMDAGVLWDFSSDALAMNIFLPDPLRQGLWDWRAAYYMDVNPPPNSVQPQVIDFLKTTNWAEFLIEYHKKTPFKGFLPPTMPVYPIFNCEWQGRAIIDKSCKTDSA